MDTPLQKYPVVLDANIFVSFLLAPSGSIGNLLQLWQNRILQVYITREIYEEVARVTKYSKITSRIPPETRLMLLRLLLHATFKTPQVPALNVIEVDPSDNKYLECALAASARWIITGDKHLLQLKKYQGIHIITPRQFLQQLK